VTSVLAVLLIGGGFYVVRIMPFVEASKRCTQTEIGTDANLSLCNFGKRDLSNKALAGADLSNAFLEGTNLTGADLTGAILTNASLSSAILTDANLDSAILDHVSPHQIEGLTPEMIQMVASWELDLYEAKSIYKKACDNAGFQWALPYTTDSPHSSIAVTSGSWHNHRDYVDFSKDEITWDYSFSLPIEEIDIRFIDTVVCIHLDSKLIIDCGDVIVNGYRYSIGAYQRIVVAKIVAPFDGTVISEKTFYGSSPEECGVGSGNTYGSKVKKEEVEDWVSEVLK
jgi:hypothetical protein